MPPHPSSRRIGRGPSSGSGTPRPPRLPNVLDCATPEHLALRAEAQLRALKISDADLSGTSAESVEFHQCHFLRADLHHAILGRAVMKDCWFESSNLASLRMERTLLQRVRMASLRMTGLQCIAGAIEDMDVIGCRLDLSSFRFTNVRRSVFQDCNLVGADFQNADLRGTQFIGCDLEGAQFSHAKLEGARFVDCVLSGVGGVASFRGAVVRSEDLLSLSRVLATALGITIEHGDSEAT